MIKSLLPQNFPSKKLRSFHHFCTFQHQNPQYPNPKGKLSIVATPIGNLSDLTPNIIKCLFKADIIGCEDRRVAGQLYTLIRNKNIVQRMEDKFGSLGISNLVLKEGKEGQPNDEDEMEHTFYNYSNMNERERRRFLGKMSLQQQKKFKIDYLKYRAKKIVNKQQQFLYKETHNPQLYGIQISDYKWLQSQIMKTRSRKGRGILIPLNTYSETKLFDMVRNMLESKHVAIVSDAGMPCISDPGWKMIRMVREAMPGVEVEVIGGPSAIDVMMVLAKGVVKGQAMSGRFQGFASPEISSITEENLTYNKFLQQAKQKDFSIHFINSRKMKKNAYSLQRIYGEEHKIILANQLTKKYERKFSGNLKQLVEHISGDNKQFQGIGEMSYLLYSGKSNQVEKQSQNKIKKEKAQVQLKENKEEKKIQNQASRIVSININKFVESLKNTPLKSKQKAELISAVFGLKHNQSKRIVYSNITNKKPTTKL